MAQYLTVVPAYGRDYTSQRAVREAWESGKDFQISDMSSRYDGSYINKSDKPDDVIINIRYKGMTRICQIT